MKLSSIFNLHKNKRNNQFSFSLKKKQMTKYGLSPEQILEFEIKKRRKKRKKK